MTLHVEIFASPGCSQCGRAKDVLQKVVAELGSDRITWREVNVLDELDYAVKLGVLSTPTIAVDGELVFTALPSAKKLRQILESRLQARGE